MATTDKYDRQLRLWGANGQQALMHAHILVVGAGATATETLKNLVLPGIGRFTILDSELVTAADLSNNFFVTLEYLGKPRAQACAELLQEMNPDVRGEFRHADPQTVLEQEPDYFAGFTLVIATGLPESTLLALSELLHSRGVPLIVPRSYGLLGSIRLQLVDHTIVESKPDTEQFDLRLANPFPELEEFANRLDLSKMDPMEHAHTPYVVILLHALKEWKQQHGGSLPATFDEKNDFKELVKGMASSMTNELNFQEAYKDAYKAYVIRELPAEVQEIMEHPKAHSLSADSQNFWFLARALARFVSEHGVPPLGGQIPDMTASTAMYVGLQQVYQAKAAQDKKAMKQYVVELLEAVGKSVDSVSDEEVDIFCKNVYNIQAVSNRTLAEERNSPASEAVMMASLEPYEDEQQTPILWYLALRAADRFHNEHGRYPGSDNAQLEADAQAVWALLQAIAAEYGQELPLTEAHAQEIVRYGAIEIHSIAAIVGGIASQEVVKIITHQYVPLNNTLIFNGICTVSAVYEL